MNRRTWFRKMAAVLGIATVDPTKLIDPKPNVTSFGYDIKVKKLEPCQGGFIIPENQQALIKLLIENGCVTINEVRRWYNLPDLPHGDRPIFSRKRLYVWDDTDDKA